MNAGLNQNLTIKLDAKEKWGGLFTIIKQIKRCIMLILLDSPDKTGLKVVGHKTFNRRRSSLSNKKNLH